MRSSAAQRLSSTVSNLDTARLPQVEGEGAKSGCKKAVHAGCARGLKVCGRAYGGRQGSVILLWQGAGSNGWAAPVAFRLQVLAVALARGSFRQTPAVRYDAGLVWTPCSRGAAVYRARDAPLLEPVESDE